MRTSGFKRVLAKAVLASLAVLFSMGSLHAAITGASGRVQSTVQQTNATTGQTIDQATEESPGTTNILPATAQASLDITTETETKGRLQATAAVNVPGENAPADTNDFALEAAGLSLLEGSGFTSTATATQTRQITLSAAELNRRSGAQVQIRSNFVFSTGVFLLTLPDGPTDVVGRVEVTIQQHSESGSEEVLAGTIEVSFDANGNLQTSATGDLAGITPLTLDLIPLDPSDTSDKVQQARLALLSDITLPYQYQVVVDQPFTLAATVTATVISASGNQAGSAFFGRLPRLLADSTNEFLQVDFSDDLDAISDILQNGSGFPGGSEVIPSIIDLIPSCGSLGFEAPLAGLLLATALLVRRCA